MPQIKIGFYLLHFIVFWPYYGVKNLFLLLSRNELVPIVMGARPEDYARSAPYKSYIHVDDFESPKELAEYLHKLDQDDNLYNEYFKWKVMWKLYLLWFRITKKTILVDKNKFSVKNC